MKPILIIFLIIFSSSISIANSKKDSSSSYINLVKKIDSLKIIVTKLSQDKSQPYQEILEKTNQQLSLWFNPYALMIASLAVLFTLLAITAAVIIYLQGKEFKEKIDSFLQGYRELLDKLVKEWQTRLSEIDKKISDFQKQLETATGVQKEMIETELQKLKNERASVNHQIASTVVPMPASGSVFSFSTNRFHTCSKCGTIFDIDRTPSHFMSMSPNMVQCPNPNCKNIEKHYG